MKNFFIVLAVLTFFPVFAYQRNQEIYSSYNKVILKNSFLELTFAPEQLGRLASAKLLKNNVELTDDFKILRYQETPLFYLDTNNFQGIRELFWRQDVSGVSPMKVVKKTDNTITLTSPSYGGTNLAAQKTITLNPQELIVNFNTIFTNVGNKTEKISIWLNLQGSPPALPIIPILGKGKVPSRGEVNLYYRPFIFTGATGNSYLPPADSWAGFRLVGRKTSWVMECKALKTNGSQFYSWGNVDNRAPIRTVEPILPEFSLKPNETSTPINYRVLVFPGLENINALCNTTAAQLDIKANQSLTLHLCSAQNIAKTSKVSLNIKDKNNKVSFQKEWIIPARKAGEVITLTTLLKPIKIEKATLKIDDTQCEVFFEKDISK